MQPGKTKKKRHIIMARPDVTKMLLFDPVKVGSWDFSNSNKAQMLLQQQQGHGSGQPVPLFLPNNSAPGVTNAISEKVVPKCLKDLAILLPPKQLKGSPPDVDYLLQILQEVDIPNIPPESFRKRRKLDGGAGLSRSPANKKTMGMGMGGLLFGGGENVNPSIGNVFDSGVLDVNEALGGAVHNFALDKRGAYTTSGLTRASGKANILAEAFGVGTGGNSTRRVGGKTVKRAGFGGGAATGGFGMRSRIKSEMLGKEEEPDGGVVATSLVRERMINKRMKLEKVEE